MKKLIVSSLAVFALVLGSIAIAADKADVSSLKCPVSGKACVEASATPYKDGSVYFCCKMCPKAFAADTAKFATKANEQLVLSGQYEQVKCPISGEAFVADQVLEVGGVKVHFCCDKCLGKVKAAEGDAQLDLVFGDDAFAKGFAKKK